MTAAASPREALGVHALGYDLVARLYLDGPTALAAEAQPAAAFLDALGSLDPTWPAQIEPLLAHMADASRLARLEQSYESYVVLPLPSWYVPPYESIHVGESGLWNETSREVERLYAEANFSWRPSASRARPLAPDHLGLELAFVAVSEVEAGPNPAAEEAERLASFIERHLLRWLPSYLDALEGSGADPFLPGWVVWAMELARHDHARLSSREGTAERVGTRR